MLPRVGTGTGAACASTQIRDKAAEAREAKDRSASPPGYKARSASHLLDDSAMRVGNADPFPPSSSSCPFLSSPVAEWHPRISLWTGGIGGIIPSSEPSS